MFHRNDPELMDAMHNDMPTIQNPDIILARKQTIVASQKGEHLDPTQAPLQPFHWSIIDLTVEDKCYKKKIDPPPVSYSTPLSLYIPVAKDVRKPLDTRPIPDPGESAPSVEDLDDELDGEEEEPEDNKIPQRAGRAYDRAKKYGEDGEDGEEEGKESKESEEGEESEEDREGSVHEGNTKATSKSPTADILGSSKLFSRYPQRTAFLYNEYGGVRTVRTEATSVGKGRHSFKEIKTYDRSRHDADCPKCASCF
jgi:hypothetical protein